MREIVIPETVTSFPVGAIPSSSPVWVPRNVQREVTASPSAIWSSTVIRPSGNACA